MGTRGDVQVPCHVCMRVMPLVIEESLLAMSKCQTCLSAPSETVAASRVQPFVLVGVRLLEAGHRVRLASHAEFRGVVTAAGLEFYPLGGDSKSLGRCAAQSQGVLPNWRMVAPHEGCPVLQPLQLKSPSSHKAYVSVLGPQEFFLRAISRLWMSCGARCARPMLRWPLAGVTDVMTLQLDMRRKTEKDSCRCAS